MIRILLTGVSGQVGSALRGPLCSIGTVLAADRTILDLSRPESLLAALDKLSPDLIINPAAYTSVDQAEDEPELAHRVNVVAPQVLARWAANPRAPMVRLNRCRSMGRANSPERLQFGKPAEAISFSAPLGFSHRGARIS